MKMNIGRKQVWLNDMLTEFNQYQFHPSGMTKLCVDQKLCIYLAQPPVWPDKNRQMSIKVAQKWFHQKMIDDRHLYKKCLRMWEIWAN